MRPISARRSSTVAIASGRVRRAASSSARSGPGSTPTGIGDGDGEQAPRRHLGVERLGRRHGHLDVAPVARVQHAVGLVGQVAVAPVHDGDDGGAPTPGQVDGPVRVGRRPRLADGDDERVGHVAAHPEARELGRGLGLDDERVFLDEGAEEVRQRLGGDGGGALADHRDPADGARGQALDDVGGEHVGPRRTTGPSGPSTSLPRSVLRKDAGASPISFSRKCGCSPRSMSRVVICARASSDSVTGSGVPS